MSTQSAFHVLRGRLHLQIERNQWLETKNKSLLTEIAELERQRRQTDSSLVLLIKRIERYLEVGPVRG